MKYVALLCLLIVSSLQQSKNVDATLTFSSRQNTEILFQGSMADARKQGLLNNKASQVNDRVQVSAEKSSNMESRASLKNGAQWVYSTLTGQSIDPYLTIFKITFCNDCPKQAFVTLNLWSSGHFWAYREYPSWHYIGNGSPWTFYSFSVPVQCGKNEIIVYVFGKIPGIAYWITQNQSNCYDCKNSMTGFYNRDTCQCECIQKCECNYPLTWYDYPTCGCMCKQSQYCQKPRYWNAQRCACVCPPLCCPRGYIPDERSCYCRWGWVNPWEPNTLPNLASVQARMDGN